MSWEYKGVKDKCVFSPVVSYLRAYLLVSTDVEHWFCRGLPIVIAGFLLPSSLLADPSGDPG